MPDISYLKSNDNSRQILICLGTRVNVDLEAKMIYLMSWVNGKP